MDTLTLTALPFSNDVGSVLSAAAALSVPKLTVIVAVPLLPSEVAVIMTVPLSLPVTVTVLPLPETVAIVVLLLDQLIGRPVRMFPLASRSVAVRLAVPFWVVMVADEGEMVTLATSAWTITLHERRLAIGIAEQVPGQRRRGDRIGDDPTGGLGRQVERQREDRSQGGDQKCGYRAHANPFRGTEG